MNEHEIGKPLRRGARVCLSIAAIALTASAFLVAQGGLSPQAAQVLQQLAAKAGAGQFDPQEADEALRATGMDWEAQESAIAKLQEIDHLAKADGANTDQNKSGTGTWPLGMVYPGVKYTTTYPLTNGCRVAQNVSIAHDDGIPITIAPVVSVDRYSTKDVPMELQFPPLPPGTLAPSAATCTPKSGIIDSVHHQNQSLRKTEAGTYTYTCQGTEVIYKVSVCLYNGPAPDDGGGGGKPKKLGPKPDPSPNSPDAACAKLWNAGVVTRADARSLAKCTPYIRQRAHELFDELLQPYRAMNPAKWAWVPAGSAIDSLSVQQILVLKTVVYADLSEGVR